MLEHEQLLQTYHMTLTDMGRTQCLFLYESFVSGLSLERHVSFVYYLLKDWFLIISTFRLMSG